MTDSNGLIKTIIMFTIAFAFTYMVIGYVVYGLSVLLWVLLLAIVSGITTVLLIVLIMEFAKRILA